jgi:hypothetical protein
MTVDAVVYFLGHSTKCAVPIDGFLGKLNHKMNELGHILPGM